jgi:pimeloyl-ACP methyl ester carboxylesterase
MATAERPREASRARYPDEEGYVERDGVRVFYEVYGNGEPTVFLLPTWSIVHSRIWKAQIAYLARHFRVLTFDGRGNGRSDRPSETAAYDAMEFANDALAVMDASGTDSAVNVSVSAGTTWSLIMAAMHPERVLGAVFVGPTTYAVSEPTQDWVHTPFNERLDSYEGANRYNRHFIREHYAQFAEWWSEVCTPEPHSTRPIEFGLEMGLDTTPEVVLATLDAAGMETATSAVDRFAHFGPMLRQLASHVRCPVLVVQGGQDRVCLPEWGRALAEDTGGELLMMPEAGHVPQGRKPVRFNLALREFVERVASSSA